MRIPKNGGTWGGYHIYIYIYVKLLKHMASIACPSAIPQWLTGTVSSVSETCSIIMDDLKNSSIFVCLLCVSQRRSLPRCETPVAKLEKQSEEQRGSCYQPHVGLELLQ